MNWLRSGGATRPLERIAHLGDHFRGDEIPSGYYSRNTQRFDGEICFWVWHMNEPTRFPQNIGAKIPSFRATKKITSPPLCPCFDAGCRNRFNRCQADEGQPMSPALEMRFSMTVKLCSSKYGVGIRRSDSSPEAGYGDTG